jgi:AP-2 complex subunit alpha
MCDRDSARAIVGELQNYLPQSDYAIREELVLKMAILAEKYADDFSWYIDVILNLMSQAGDFVSDDIWYRVIQIVTNSKDKDLQTYTAKSSFKAASFIGAHEAAIKIAGYSLVRISFF